MMPSSLYADEILTLKQSVEQAMSHNRQLLALSESVQQSSESVIAAQAQRLPHVNVSTAWSYTNSPLQAFGQKLEQQSITQADFTPSALNHPNYQQNYQTRLGLTLPLYAGGGLQSAYQQKKSKARASSLHFEFQRQQYMYQTIASFIQARQQWEQFEISQKSLQAAEKHWQDAQALQNKGMALGSDVMHAHVYALRSQVLVDEMQYAYQNSLEKLALLMGSNAPLTGKKIAQPKLEAVEASFEDLLAQASHKRLDFLAMQEHLQAASFKRGQVYAKDFPQVDFLAAQEWNSASPNIKNGHGMVGVTVSLNLFNGGLDHAKQRMAESSYQALQWQIADKQQSIQNELRQAWRAVSLSQKKLEHGQQALQQSRESLRIVSLRYQQGLETTASILDAQVEMDRSQLEALKAQYDVVLSQAALMLAAGLLDEGVMQ
ncbi:MAG: TolC family protein [Mariprofundaceae bacterium]